MSHFYGTLNGGRGAQATKAATVKTGLTATAASYDGAVSVDIWRDESAGVDRFRVTQVLWQGEGIRETIAEGIIGQESSLPPIEESKS